MGILDFLSKQFVDVIAAPRETLNRFGDWPLFSRGFQQTVRPCGVA
jgi:hypothetical protein